MENEWENFENEIIIEEDNIFDKISQNNDQDQKNQDQFDLFDQLAGNSSKDIKKIYENDLNFLENLASTQPIQTSQQEHHKSQINESTNQQSNILSQPKNLMGSLFSYLTSNEGSSIKPPNQKENSIQNNIEPQQNKNESQIQNVQDSISNIGASYFAAAKKTLLGDANLQKSQELVQEKKFDLQKDQFNSQNSNFEIPENHKIDQNTVLQSIIEQNKNLKSLLIKQRIEFKELQKTCQNPNSSMENPLDEILRQSSIESLNLQNFDPQKEFKEIQQLYNMNKISASQQDISYLYSSCFYSKDLLLIQNLKVKIFQAIAERALRNQEILFKSTKRRGLQFSDINPIHIYIENNQMRQTNQGLRGQLEQLQQTLQNQVNLSNRNEKAYKDKIISLGASLENQKKKISKLKQNWLNLKNESKQLNSQLKDPKIFQGIKSLIHDSASRYDKEIETFRKSLLQKNKEIGDLFMKNKKQEENFEYKLQDLEKNIRSEQEKDLGTLVFQKNQEIAKQYNENLQFKQKIESLQQERYEQLEIQETVQQESAMLKDQLRGYQSEKKKLFDQIQNLEQLNKEIQSQADEYQSYIDQLQTQISGKDGELQEMQEFIQIKNDELNKMEDEIDEYQIDIDKKNGVIDQLQNQIKQIENLKNNDQLQSRKLICDLQSKVSQLEQQLKDSIIQKVQIDPIIQNIQIETPILKTIPKLNLQNINKSGNNVLFQVKQNETKEQQNINDIFRAQIPQINEENDQDGIDLNNEVINEWGASMSSDIDLQQSINLQSNETEQNQNDAKDPAEDELIRMKSHLDSAKLDIIISQIQKPNQEIQKLDQFFSELKTKKEIETNEMNEELDREILNNEQIESNLIHNDIANNNQHENEKVEIHEQQWGELDIQLESDRTIEKSIEEVGQNQQPSKRRQKHKKQKSVHLKKSNQFQNYNNQDLQNDQENQSVKRENQMQFFQDLNEQDQNTIVTDQNNLNAINEEDSNAQGDSSARKENSKELKNSLSNRIKPQIEIEKIESAEKQKNHINQKEKDNDFNSSVFPDSIHNENEKDEEQDMMIMTINSGDVNLQLLDSVQSGKYSFIQDGLQNNIQSANSPQKYVQDFVLEYQENNQFTSLDKDLMDGQEVEVQEMNIQKKFHQKSSQSFHQRNAEMIDQVIMGTQVTDKLEDEEYLQKRLIEQLQEYDLQNNSQQPNLIQDFEIVNIKPPAQPDEQIQTDELPEQILSDLEDDLDIMQNQNQMINSVDKDQITSIFEEQSKNQLIETIPEMEIEDDDENILQEQILQKSFENEKVEESKTENIIELELQDDLWGGDTNMDLFLNQQNEVQSIENIKNEILDDYLSHPEDNHLQKSQQYQNKRKSNKQKQKDKLNLKDKFLLLNKNNSDRDQGNLESMKDIDNQMKTQTSEIQDINRMILEDINQKEKEDAGNIFNQISITQQNRALESARVLTSNPLQQFQQARNDLEDEQILQSSTQKLPHGHSNSQQFSHQNQNKPLKTIRQNKKQVPNPIIKNMMENVTNSYLPSESLEEVEDSYKESEFYSPIKKRFEDQTSYITSSEYNGLSSQKKMRKIQMINQLEEESLQEIETYDYEEKDKIEKVIEDVKGEEMDEDDKIQIIESQQNDADVVFSELDAENEFNLGMTENQNSQNKVEVFDQILKGQQEAQNIDYIDLNSFQMNDFENEIQSIQSIASGSIIHSVQETKKEENINQLFDFVNFEKEQIQQVQKQMDSVQQNFKQQRKNLTDQNKQ